MRKDHRRIDKVRASRDGHEFHEAWAARKALQLVTATDGLVGIAVEGLAPSDSAGTSAETVEIADLVLYYGKRPTFQGAHSVVIVQVKYSIGSQGVPFRASDGRKTIRKFAAAFRSHKRQYGAKDVERKLAFELITNRPVYREFVEAIDGLASGSSLGGISKRQAAQFASACGFKGKQLAEFAQKVRITGLAGSLWQNKQQLSRVLADWSVAPDAMARARLGNMRQLLRDKAGQAGDKQNVVTRTDVLDAFELQSPADLFPCPESFPEVGKVVEREQLSGLVRQIPTLDKPLLIHADGGIGKTVFLQSLAKMLGETHEVVLFDCFGGGAYRAPEDARHLPKRGLIHIINKLACDGLCDPLLPINENVEDLVRAFRSRLAQAVATLQRASPQKQLLLFIDAIDNAAEHARDRHEPAFPRLLLESFHHAGRPAGVHLVVSCRTYRRDISRGDTPCEELELGPFSPSESDRYLRDRIPKVTDAEVQVAYSRSEGNPRILEHLALSDRGLLDRSQVNKVIKLDDLLRERIRKALEEALKRGYKAPDINAFLAGLSVLPPPVPLGEYADAHGWDVSAVRSFAADLAPLLEQTRQGLMLRDEPTETLVREDYAANVVTLRTLAENLFKKQGASVYAASALPGLLQKLDDGKLLFDLAFDERFPSAITSAVGKQNIRYARLKAAVRHAARNGDFNRLVHLLVELSTLAAVNQRGTDFVLDNPDLVVASHDVDATRRLFEIRTRWPGTRYARLSIASALSGDASDALRHAVSAEEWIRHFYRQDDEYRRDRSGPERLDIASIPVCLVAHDRGPDAGRFMKGWKDWYAFEVAEHIFTLLRQAESAGAVPTDNIRRFVNSLKLQPGLLAGALSFLELDNVARRRLTGELAKACAERKTVETTQDFHQQRHYSIRDGLLKAAAVAISLGMRSDAQAITSTIPSERPRLWSFTDRFSADDAFYFVTLTALRAAIERRSLAEHALLPQELVDMSGRVATGIAGESFRKGLKAELEKDFKTQKEASDEKGRMSYESKREAEGYIDERLSPLLEIAQAFSMLLSSGLGKGESPFLKLVEVWIRVRAKRDLYSDFREVNRFFDLLGRRVLIFALWTRNDLHASTVAAFTAKVGEDGVAPASTLVEIVAMLSRRAELQELAGKMAVTARTVIEREDDVSCRASLFARLSRAVMPASVEETTAYFRASLEQMDAIGSGDYQFTNELLLYSAGLRGDELEEGDFHTLANICELNMSSDEEKFPWLAFARGLARASGCRALARLGRWDDRAKVSLDYTLLPYLTALIEQDKIDPAIALGLLRVSDPAELHVCGTEELAEVIAGKRYANSKELLAELMLQFGQSHSGVFMPSTLAKLHRIAEREFGRDSEQAAYLSQAVPKFERLRDEGNENRNYRGAQEYSRVDEPDDQEQRKRALKSVEAATDPADEASMSRAVEALETIERSFDLRDEFFRSLRGKLQFAERPKYIQIVARLETLDIYAKLRELKECKEKWSGSSAALEGVFHDIGTTLIEVHADDLVQHDYLSGSILKDIAELSGNSMSELVLKSITMFAAPDSHVPASVWMGIAAIICEEAKPGEGQVALKRLLNSRSAKLASTVVDGPWKEGLYPKSGETDIAAGLVWLGLGSPSAACRWRSAHSIRSFARLGKWEVVDAVIGRMDTTDALPYQASELPFYFLHARLWLLIAIARVAMDHPQAVARYAGVLRAVALDRNTPHVLARHFAAEALLTCAGRGSVVLSKADAKALKKVNESPFPRRKSTEYPRSDIYQSRPDSMPEKEPEFHLDYDFDKHDVTGLSDMFERSRWETKDAVTACVRRYDPDITSMYENRGRSRSGRNQVGGMTARYQTYGQQLGWHALNLVAGDFLSRYPLVQRPYDDGDSWSEWLGRRLLTRNDGLWLADGVDRPPVDAQVNLYEKGEKALVLTGDKAKILALLNIESCVSEDVVVAGDWRSSDGIGIHIASALVPPRHAAKSARQLAKEDPFRVWLPRVEEYEDRGEYSRSERGPYQPWIVWPSTEARLDETDPLGVTSAVRRLHFTKAVNAIRGLVPLDPFNRRWADPDKKVAAHSQAWGRNREYDEDEAASGERLICRSDFLKQVLLDRRAELLVLIVLRRYERGVGSGDSKYWHTTAVIRISQSLDFEYYAGATNKLHVMKY